VKEPRYPNLFYNRGLALESIAQYKHSLADLCIAYQLFVRPDARKLCSEATTRVTEKIFHRAVPKKKEADEEFEEKRYNNAIKLYSEAIELEPNFPNPYYNRGLCYEVLAMRTDPFEWTSQKEQALTDFKRAKQLFLRHDSRGKCQEAIDRITGTKPIKPKSDVEAAILAAANASAKGAAAAAEIKGTEEKKKSTSPTTRRPSNSQITPVTQSLVGDTTSSLEDKVVYEVLTCPVLACGLMECSVKDKETDHWRQYVHPDVTRDQIDSSSAVTFPSLQMSSNSSTTQSSSWSETSHRIWVVLGLSD